MSAASPSRLLASLFALAVACAPASRAPQAPTAGTVAIPRGAPQPAEVPFAVTFSGPRGQAPEGSQLTVVFSRPLRSLNLAEDQPPPPLQLEPALPGEWQWVGTNALVFAPQSGHLPAATEVKVTIPAELSAADGTRLGAAERFGFETPRPALDSTFPQEGSTGLETAQTFELYFNQPIAAAELQRAARLTAHAAGRVKTLPFKVEADASSPKRLRVVPTTKLPPHHKVHLEIAADLRGTEGPLPALAATHVEFETYGPLTAEVSCSLDGPHERCNPEGGFSLAFSTPVRVADLKRAVSVTPAVPLQFPEWQDDDDWVSYVPVSAPLKAGAACTVTVGQLRDNHGQALAAPVTYTLQFDDYWPRLELGLSGDTFESAARAVLPVASLNVPQYTLWAAPVSVDQVSAYYALGRHSAEGFAYLRKVAKGARTVRPRAAKNRPHVESVDPSQVLARTGGRGLMLLATQYKGRWGDEERIQIVQVGELALSAKLSRQAESLVWVTELSSGKPVPNAAVSLLGGGSRPQAVTTDAQGLARLPAGALGDEPARHADAMLLVARRGHEVAFRQVSDSLYPWKAGISAEPLGAPGRSGLLFTERGIYRPGDTVQLKGILRTEAATGNAIPRAQELELVLRSPDWEEVSVHPVTTSAFGTFSSELRVPRSAALGPWSALLRERGSKQWPWTSTSFQVAEYRPAETAARVASAKGSYVQGDVASFEVSGDYLFGAPMSGAEVTYAANRSETFWRVPGLDAYSTDASAVDDAYPERAPSLDALASGTQRLDAHGRLKVSVPLELPGQRSPELVHVSASIQDLSRQTVAANSSSVVHPASVYVALRRSDDAFVQGGSTLEPRFLVTTPEGRALAGKAVDVELVRRRWSVARETSGHAHSELHVEDTVVARCSGRSKAKDASCRLQVPESGYFLLVAKSRDERGRVARAATSLYALGSGENFWSDSDDAVVELVPNQAQYQVGDTAKILIKSPFKEADALITVEGDDIKTQRRVRLTGATPTVEIPITDSLRPNAYVGVHLLRPRTAPPPAPGGADLGAPSYRFGYQQLNVDPESRRLRVAIRPARKELRPAQTVEADLEVLDAAGKPAAAEVTVYAVDEGVLSLIDYKTPDPLPVFTAARPLRVATLETRASLGRIEPDVLRVLGLGSKGAAGGGGGAEGESSVRRDFRQSVYFNPTVRTDAKGKAHVSFKLPDSLTTFRLMAVAVTRDDRYGFGQERVVSSKPLMARPALPRLLRAGDKAEAGIIVSAKGFGPTRVSVALEATGLEVSGSPRREIELPRDGSVEVRFPLTAPQVGTAKLRFTATALGERREHDVVEVSRDVRLPMTLQAVASYGKTDTVAAEDLGDLSSARRDAGGLELRLASTALIGLDGGFEQLIDYPYGCTEQLSSRLLPLLVLRDLARDFNTPLPKKVDDVAETTLAELLGRQHGDGGFGLWPESAESSPWVSAQVTWTLHEAKQRGATVPDATLERAQQYLRAQLEVLNEPWQRAARPYFLDVLAALGAPDPGYMNRVFQERTELPAFARAQLLHAMAVSRQPQADVKTLTRELESSLRLDGPSAYFAENLGDTYAVLMDSPARTTALVLRGLLAANPQHPLAAQLARGLLDARQGGTWRSTQETAFALLALDAYRRAQESVTPQFTARLWVGDQTIEEFAFARRTTTSRSASLAIGSLKGDRVTFEKQGAGTLFYEARLRYAPRELPRAPLDRGFYVQKSLRAITPDKLQAALAVVPSEGESHFPAGGLVIADLLLVSPTARNYVVLDDPLPAGFEAVDASLSTAAAWEQISDSITDTQAPTRDGIAAGGLLPAPHRRELRDDRVAFFIDHLPAGVFHFRYLARATTLGRFIVPPTKAEGMYSPEVFGRTAASVIEVR